MAKSMFSSPFFKMQHPQQVFCCPDIAHFSFSSEGIAQYEGIYS